MHRVRRGAPPPSLGGSRIHQGLVGARKLVGTPYLADPALRVEYARDIAPRTGAALGKILRELYPGAGERRRPLRMLDLGAGTGAAGDAARAHLGNELELVSADLVPLGPAVRTVDVTDLASLTRVVGSGGPFDLVVAAHVLNELLLDEDPATRPARLAALVGRWCQSLLAEGGALVIIEPALRETSRALLGVRDNLLASGLHVVAPCYFTGPCPALLRERDWCHDSASAPPPAPTGGARTPKNAPAASAPGRPMEPNRRSPRQEHRIDFSYLVVRTAGEASADSTLFRVVSDPLPEKGRLKLFGCGLSGRQPVIRLDRHVSPANAALDDLSRGDVVHIARTTFAQDGLRVGADTTVVRPAKSRR